MPNFYHVIKDPVHGSMQFTSEEHNWIKPFIDSQNFQRLRHIKQAGLTDWIFPGAVHTRFNHCLGCCYVATQICHKLALDSESKQLVILACLLHDVGHGPFSHAFEGIFYQRAIRHEAWSPLFLNDYLESDFIERFNFRNTNFLLTEEKIDTIQRLITHQYNENKLFADIVSSQLDADRLDYLLRDSYFCGVTYGNYDFSWLLHCLTPIKQEGTSRLGITRKGIGVVEQYLMARRLMIRNVYHHGKKHAAEFLLQEFLKQLAKAITNTEFVQYKQIFSELKSNNLIKFLKFTDQFNREAEKATDLKNLSEKFINDHYDLYKQLCDYDIYALIRYLSKWDIDHPVFVIAKRLQERKLPEVIRVDEQNVSKAQAMINEFKHQHREIIADWQIALFDLPHLSYEIKQDPLLIEDFPGTAKYLHDDSLVINAISDRTEDSYLISFDAEIFQYHWVDEFFKRLQLIGVKDD